MIDRILFAALAPLALAVDPNPVPPLGSGNSQPIYASPRSNALLYPIAVGTPPQQVIVHMTADAANAADAGQLVVHSEPAACRDEFCSFTFYNSTSSSSANVSSTTRLGGPFYNELGDGPWLGGPSNLTSVTDIVSLGGSQRSRSLWVGPPKSYPREQYPGGQLDFGIPAPDTTPWWDGLWENRTVGLQLNHISWAEPLNLGPKPNFPLLEAGKLTFGGIDTAVIDTHSRDLPIRYLPRAGNDSRWTFHVDKITVSLVEGQRVTALHLWDGQLDVQMDSPRAALTFEDVIALPLAAYERLVANVPGMLKGDDGGMVHYNVPCDTTASLIFTVGRSRFYIHPSDWVRQVTPSGIGSPHPLCMHVFRPSLDYLNTPLPLGQAFLKSVYTVFNYTTGEVAFLPLNNTTFKYNEPANFEDPLRDSSAARPLLPVWLMAASLLALVF